MVVCAFRTELQWFRARRKRVRTIQIDASSVIQSMCCCIKTCTPVGTLREVAPTVVAAMHAEYVFLRMSGSTIICKTQYLVNIERRLAARSGAQVKRHKTNQNQRGAVYAAAIELPLALLSMWRRSLGDPRSALASAAGLPTFSKSSSLDRPRPVTMPRSYNMYNIGMRDD